MRDRSSLALFSLYIGRGFPWGRKLSVRENRRKARGGRSARGWYLGAALLVIGLGGVLHAGWPRLSRYAIRHPYFSVQDIVVDSDGRFSPEEVRTWSGLALGMSLWEIEPAAVEARLCAQPWIHSAQVRREFPQQVHVTVTARRPVAIVLQPSLLYLDDTGAPFAGHTHSEEKDLPYVTGFAGIPLDTLAARTALAGVSTLLSLARLWQEPLSEIHWDPQRGYTVFLERRRVAICFGRETTPEKFMQVGMVLAAWPVEGPAALFDARFANQIVVRPYGDARGPRAHDLARPL